MEKVLVKRETNPWGGILTLVELDNDTYAILQNGKELVRATGDNALSALDRYYNAYYNIVKHSLYPEMPYPEDEFEILKNINYHVFSEIEKLCTNIEDPAERNKACIEKYKKLMNKKEK